MFFRNADYYRVARDFSLEESQLMRRQFQPCGPQDAEFRGWAAPAENGGLIHQIGGVSLICLQTEKKILPASVVRQHAEERAKLIEQEQGFKIGRKQMRELKDEVARELLPKALAKRSRTYAMFIKSEGLLVIDASSSGRSEDILESLRQSLDTFPLKLLRTNVSPISFMSDCLASGEAPDGFTLDDSCELHSITEDHTKVKYANYSLGSDDIKEHLAQGRLPTRLAMTHNDRVSFVLHESGRITKLGFLDVVTEQTSDAKDSADLFDSQLTICAAEIAGLINSITSRMGGELNDLADAA